jgi:hypothetical protein
MVRASEVRDNKINAHVNFTLPCWTPSRKYALAASLLLKTITTDADTIKQWAILNSGATSHFLTTSVPKTNILPTAMPIIAPLPNGDQVHSTHTCTLDIPSLLPGECVAYIIPGLALHLLQSVVTMCNAVCTITFSKIGCTSVYRGRTIVCGHKCTRTGLWMIPLTEVPTPPASMSTTSPISIKLDAKVDATSLAAKYARYVHQLLCSPPAATLLHALEKSTEVQTIPGLMPALVFSHLPRPTATNKGHMCCHCDNTASTRNKHADVILAQAEVNCMFPTHKLARPRICFVLPPSQMPRPVPCTQTSPMLSLSGHSRT